MQRNQFNGLLPKKFGIVSSETMLLADCIYKIPDSLLPETEIENKRVWQSHPLEKAIYLSTLDKFTIEDEFFIALRKGSGAIFDCGLERVGDLIALTRQEVANRSGISSATMHRLENVLSKMGLSLASDVSLWREYRATVPPDFRLTVPYQMRLPNPGSSARAT